MLALVIAEVVLGALILLLGRTQTMVRAGAALGVLLSAAVVITDPVGWRSLTGDDGARLVAGVGSAVAWSLLAVEGGVGVDLRLKGGLIAGATAALVAAATAGWAVPFCALIVLSLAACFCLALVGRSALAAGIAGATCVGAAAGIVLEVARSDGWRLAPTAGGIALWLFVLAAGIAVGGSALALTVRPDFGTPCVLVLSAGFVVFEKQAARPEPVLAAVVLACSLAIAAVSAARPAAKWAALWVAVALVGFAFTAPGEVGALGAATALALGALAAWRPNEPAASVARGLALAVPIGSLGWLGAAGAGRSAFSAATSGEEGSLWIAPLVFFPLVLAAALLFSRAIIHGEPSAPRDRLAGVAAALAPAGLLLLGFLPPSSIPESIGSFTGEEIVLYGVAGAVGFVVAFLVLGRERPVSPALDPGLVLTPLEVPHSLQRGLYWGGLVAVVAAIVLSVWLTFSGLRVGFL